MLDEHSPLIRVFALRTLEYCERLFYLEEVEDIQVADAAVFAGRTLHVELEQVDDLDQSGVPVNPQDLGDVGAAMSKYGEVFVHILP